MGQDASEGLQDAVLASDAADLASLLPDAGPDLQEPVVRVYPDASAP